MVGEVRETHQEILFDVTGQSLIWDAPEGRPSSVTRVAVEVTQGDDSTADEFTPTGTVETNPATTLDASAGVGQSDLKNIPLTATTGIVQGRRYLLTSAANGLKEWVEVEKIVSADTVSSRHPLQNAYVSADTFQTTRITAPVDATWVADENKISPESSTFPYYRVVWVYVVGGVTYRHETSLDLVRTTAQHTVTPVDVAEIKATWLDELPVDSRRDQGRALIERAFRNVKRHLLADGKLGRWVRYLDVMNDLVAYQAIVLSEGVKVSNFGVGFNASYEAARQDYQQIYDQLIREPKVPIQSTPGGSAQPGTRLPLFVR
jgi:hypothetical protein